MALARRHGRHAALNSAAVSRASKRGAWALLATGAGPISRLQAACRTPNHSCHVHCMQAGGIAPSVRSVLLSGMLVLQLRRAESLAVARGLRTPLMCAVCFGWDGRGRGLRTRLACSHCWLGWQL